jgi:hypothetical protein
MDNTMQRQTVKVGRGLFLVRYSSADDEKRPPKVTVSCNQDSDLEFHLHPGHQEPVLWQPGSCLVVETMVPTTFDVEVSPAGDGDSSAATVKIETLTQGKSPASGTQSQDQNTGPAKHRASSVDNVDGLRVLGHLAGRGDVWVEANEWLGGPTAPSRIEGIAIEWPDKPSDLDLRYALKSAKLQPNSGRTTGLGSFAGTRGKSMPVVSIMVELTGAQAANFQLSAEAIFLGAPAKRFTGKRIVASGPTGREPLVGLRLSLDSMASPRTLAKSSSRKAGRSTGSVRVFRSRAKANHAEPV